MTTVKLKFRPSSSAKAEGTLYYQLSHKRSVKCISTGHHILPHEWDASKETIAIPARGERKARLELMQRDINQHVSRWHNIFKSLEKHNKAFSLDEIGNAFYDTHPRQTVFAFLQKQVFQKEMMKRHGTARTYANASKRFMEFRKGADLAFDELTPHMMECYEAWLIDRRMKQNSIRCYLRTLHTLFNKAADEGLLTERNLFGHIRLSYVNTTKRAVTINELKTLAQLQLPQGSATAFARDIFMFSFYMRGMPFVDIAYLRKTDLKNGTLTYCRKKTNQCLSVAWEKAQQQIVERHAGQTNDSPYLLPIIQKADGTEYWQYQRMQTNINRALKKLGKRIGLKMPLTTYVARHTWASIARDMNISVAIISEGMGHNSLKTTQVYLNSIDTSKIDEANKKIIRKIND